MSTKKKTKTRKRRMASDLKTEVGSPFKEAKVDSKRVAWYRGATHFNQLRHNVPQFDVCQQRMALRWACMLADTNTNTRETASQTASQREKD